MRLTKRGIDSYPVNVDNCRRIAGLLVRVLRIGCRRIDADQRTNRVDLWGQVRRPETQPGHGSTISAPSPPGIIRAIPDALWRDGHQQSRGHDPRPGPTSPQCPLTSPPTPRRIFSRASPTWPTLEYCTCIRQAMVSEPSMRTYTIALSPPPGMLGSPCVATIVVPAFSSVSRCPPEYTAAALAVK